MAKMVLKNSQEQTNHPAELYPPSIRKQLEQLEQYFAYLIQKQLDSINAKVLGYAFQRLNQTVGKAVNNGIVGRSSNDWNAQLEQLSQKYKGIELNDKITELVDKIPAEEPLKPAIINAAKTFFAWQPGKEATSDVASIFTDADFNVSIQKLNEATRIGIEFQGKELRAALAKEGVDPGRLETEMGLVFDLPYEDVRMSEILTHRQKYLQDVLGETTYKRADNLIEGGIKAGKSFDQIAAELHASLGMDQDRAMKIARTETNWALSNAQLQYMNKLGVKQYRIVLATNACEECIKVAGWHNGQLGDPVSKALFDVTNEDVLPVHPNCRCLPISVIPKSWVEIGKSIREVDLLKKIQTDRENLMKSVNHEKAPDPRQTKIELLKGEPGYTPKKGEDYYTESEVEELKKAITPVKGRHYFTSQEIEEFRKSVTPIKGRDYLNDQELQEIMQKSTPRKDVDYRDGVDGKPGRDGKTPRKGVDYFTNKEIEALFAKYPNTGQKDLGELQSTLEKDLGDKVTKAVVERIQSQMQVISPKPKWGEIFGDITTQTDLVNYVASHGGSGGATKFTQLTDVPNSYAGQAGKIARVNPGETGLEFGVSSASVAWGGITGTISSQNDLQTALNAKVNTSTTVNGHALSSNVTVTAADIGLGSVDNTSDANKPISTATQTALNLKEDAANKDSTVTLGISNTKYPTQNAVKTYVDTGLGTKQNSLGFTPENTANKDQINGYPSLDGSGKVPSSELPAMVISNTYVVVNQAAMLALAANVGDIAIRTDIAQSFILQATPASVLGNWQQLLTPPSPVTAVFGRSGAISATNGDYTASQITNVPAGGISAVTVQAAINALDSTDSGKVTGNAPITAGTNLKISYDVKGLVTAGTTAALTDLSDTLIATPATNQVMTYNGTKWANATPNNVSGGPGVDFYLDDTTIIATGTNNVIQVNSLLKTPNTAIAEQTDSVNVTAATSPVLDEAYLYNTPLGANGIGDAGIWELDTYCFVNSTAGGRVSSISVPLFRVVLGVGTFTTTGAGTTRTLTVTGSTPFVAGDFNAARDLSGYVQTPQGLYKIAGFTSTSVVTITTLSTYVNETAAAFSLWRNLFQMTTNTITVTTVSRDLTQSAQPAYVGLATDKLGAIYFGVSNNTTTVSFTHNGTAHYSHFTAPLTTRHNDLAGLQGGAANDYNHLTTAQLAVVAATSGSNTGDQTYIAPRITQIVSSSTPTPNAGTTDTYEITALAAGATFGAPTGSPVDGQKLIVRVKDNGGAQTLAFTTGANGYRAGTDLAFPTTTVLGKTLYLGFVWNQTDSRWDFLAAINNI